MIGPANNAQNSRSPGRVRPCANGPAQRAAVNREARATRRRGYILIVVLGLTAIVSTLGMSFLNAHSTVMPEAVNRFRATRARYLAESGADIATHFLLYPPTTVAAGSYWQGANGIAVDATSDYTDVDVRQDAGDPNQFTVTALGVAHDFDGTTVVGTHTVTVQVLRPFDGKWRIPYAFLSTATVSVPAMVQIEGDIHANDAVIGFGWCQGNVSAVGAATWFGSGPPASVTSSAPTFPAPPADPSLYGSYNIRGDAYTAYLYGSGSLSSAQSNGLNSIDMSATNPGRIIMPPPGNLVLASNVYLEGTLVVQGDLKFDGWNIEIRAEDDFPALVVTGDIRFMQDGATAHIEGSVVCAGQIWDEGHSDIGFHVRGASVVSGPLNLTGANRTFQFEWRPDSSIFWNLAESEKVYPATLLDWKEN